MSEPPVDSASLEQQVAAFPNAKTSFPFPLSVDSRTFGLPVTRLMSEFGYKIDAVQLHVPIPDGVPTIPTEAEIEEIQGLQKNLALSTLVHVASDPRLGDTDAGRRKVAVESLITVIKRLKPLVPLAYTLELAPPCPFSPEIPRSLVDALGVTGLSDWKQRLGESLTEVSETAEVPFPSFCVETSAYPLAEVLDLVNEKLLSFCLDVGTLLRYQMNITEHMEQFMNRTKVFHLHGISPAGVPHASLAHFPFDHIVGFLGSLTSAHYVGSVCLEIRFLADLVESLQLADKAYREMRGYVT